MATAAVRQRKSQRTEPHPAEKQEVHNIAVASIKVGKRMRPLGDISSLVESIREIGLLNPILVTRDRKLISGLHRLAAFKALGRRTIPCIILSVSPTEAAIREIDENLARNDLTLLERAEHLHRRKELYEQLHPGTRHGGNRGNQHTGGKSCQDDKLSFCQNAATLSGQSSRTAQRLVRIAKLLTPETKKLLRGTDWADNQRTLMKLCKLSPDMQKAVAVKAASGESKEIHGAIAKVHRENLKARRCSVPQEGRATRCSCGDCITLMDKMPAGSVDLIVTSPPYNIGTKYSTHHDKRLDYQSWMEAVCAKIKRVMKNDGHFFLQAGGTPTDPLIPHRVMDSALRAGWKLQNEIVWVKSIAIGDTSYGHFRPIESEIFLNNTHEFIFHLTKTGTLPINRLAIGVPFVYESNITRWDSNVENCRCRGNTWHIPYETVQSKKDKHYHPAIFPTALPEMCIKLSGIPKGSLVVDPFVGTGSTLIACERLGMQGLGFDIDEAYVEAANARLLELISTSNFGEVERSSIAAVQ